MFLIKSCFGKETEINIAAFTAFPSSPIRLTESEDMIQNVLVLN